MCNNILHRNLILGSVMMLAFSEAQKPTEIKVRSIFIYFVKSALNCFFPKDSELKNLVKANPGADLE